MTDSAKQQNASSSSQGQSGWIPITAAANLDMSAQSGNKLGTIVNQNGIQPTGTFGDPIDALFGGLENFFGSGTATQEPTLAQPIPGFRIGPILTVAALAFVGVTVWRAVRK